jgi:hypothetical protein
MYSKRDGEQRLRAGAAVPPRATANGITVFFRPFILKCRVSAAAAA